MSNPGKLQLVRLIRKKYKCLSWAEAIQCLLEIRKRNGGKLIGLKLSKFMKLLAETIKVSKNCQIVEKDPLVIKKHQQDRTCSVCRKLFVSNWSRNRHIKIVHERTLTIRKSQASKFVCSFCGKSYAHQVSLKRHSLVHDIEKKKVECDRCGKAFKRVDSMWRHKENIHKLYNMNIELLKTDKKNQCQMCHVTFRNKDMFVSHMTMRACSFQLTEKDKFRCELCDKSYVYKFDLSRHIKKVH